MISHTITATKETRVGDTGAAAVTAKSGNGPMLNNRTTYAYVVQVKKMKKEQVR